jgi:hypothetical protein
MPLSLPLFTLLDKYVVRDGVPGIVNANKEEALCRSASDQQHVASDPHHPPLFTRRHSIDIPPPTPLFRLPPSANVWPYTPLITRRLSTTEFDFCDVL